MGFLVTQEIDNIKTQIEEYFARPRNERNIEEDEKLKASLREQLQNINKYIIFWTLDEIEIFIYNLIDAKQSISTILNDTIASPFYDKFIKPSLDSLLTILPPETVNPNDVRVQQFINDYNSIIRRAENIYTKQQNVMDAKKEEDENMQGNIEPFTVKYFKGKFIGSLNHANRLTSEEKTGLSRYIVTTKQEINKLKQCLEALPPEIVLHMVLDGTIKGVPTNNSQSINMNDISKQLKFIGSSINNIQNNNNKESTKRVLKRVQNEATVNATPIAETTSSGTVIGSSNQSFLSGSINSITVDSKGNVYAGGGITDIDGGVYAAYCNPSTSTYWNNLNCGTFNGSINTLGVDSKGTIYAAGNFTYTGDITNGGVSVAIINPSTSTSSSTSTLWQPLGDTYFNGNISTLVLDSNGNVYVGGYFTGSEQDIYVACFKNKTWFNLGSPGSNTYQNAQLYISTLAVDPEGENVYAAGSFVTGDYGSSSYYIASYNSLTPWSPLGSTTFNDSINTIVIDAEGNVYAAGNFTTLTNQTTGDSLNAYVACYNISKGTWSAIGSLTFNAPINTIAIDDGGNIYAGGNFTNSDGYPYVALYNKTTEKWSALGSSTSTGQITSIAIDSSKYADESIVNVYAAYNFEDNTYNVISYQNSL